MNRQFLTCLRIGVLLALTAALPAPVAANRLPNIVFILADDLGYGDIKSFGKERCRIETPHFDRLAREGVRFTNAHAAASVCVPSRMAILTGRYPFRFGRGANGGPWGFIGLQLKKSQFTIARMLQGAGYRTASIGKWHLGTAMPTKDGKVQGLTNVDYTKPLLVGPNDYGFDESFILPGSLDMYPYVFVRNHQFVGKITAKKGWSAFNRVGPAAEDFEDWKVLDTFAGEAEKFIAKEADGKRPFFLYLALTAPHTPTSPSPPFEGKSKLGIYGDFVMEVDAVVGRVLAALDRSGAAKNTLVIAASDHGPALYAGREKKATYAQLKELEKDGHYSSGPYRGYKFSVYEGGFRIPCVARWPGVVAPGGGCDALIGLQDLLATAAEITGTGLKPAEAPDSVSFLPLLRDPAAKGAREDLVVQGAPAVAFHSGAWKLALCPGSGCNGRYGNSPPQEEAWKKALESYGKTPANRKDLEKAPFVQLFHLDKDPGESKNLAAGHPGKVRELFKLINEQIASGRSTPGPRVANDRERIDLFRGIPRFVWRKRP
jgi:arylsulfatase A-like enzyme